MKADNIKHAQELLGRRRALRWNYIIGHSSKQHQGMYVVSYYLPNFRHRVKLCIYEPCSGVWVCSRVADNVLGRASLRLPDSGKQPVFVSESTLPEIVAGGYDALVRARLTGG